MGIKWEGIKVLVSPLSNNIFFGKVDKTGMFATDKSEDRTEEIITAVMKHLDGRLNGEEDKANAVKVETKAGTLIWQRNIKEGK